MSEKFISEKFRTPPVRVSYPYLFKPSSVNGGDPKFSITIMIEKKNPEQMGFLKKLYAEAKRCLENAWPNPNNRPRLPLQGHDRSPIKDADKACNQQGIPLLESNPEWEGHYIVRASSKIKPVVVDRTRNEITDEKAIYGGCICIVSLNVFSYNRPENKGVTFGLLGAQFWAKGEAFGMGNVKAEDVFDVYEIDENDLVNYESDAFAEEEAF